MQTWESTYETLEKQIEEINELLKELRDAQKEELAVIKKNHATNMQKLDKLREYNKISDMTNQLFEKRLSGIENAVIKLNNSFGKKNEM